jgi:hypothetical protein
MRTSKTIMVPKSDPVHAKFTDDVRLAKPHGYETACLHVFEPKKILGGVNVKELKNRLESIEDGNRSKKNTQAEEKKAIDPEDKGKKSTQAVYSEDIELPEVFNYVNIKYGAPKAQLRNLLEQGYYDTILHDSSGVGAGPNIKYPVEAPVFFPTPYHGSKCESLGSSFEVRVTSDVMSIPEETLYHGNQAKLVYATKVAGKVRTTEYVAARDKRTVVAKEKEKPASIGSLQFESRFESGNLFQAFQM